MADLRQFPQAISGFAIRIRPQVAAGRQGEGLSFGVVAMLLIFCCAGSGTSAAVFSGAMV